MQHKIPWWKSYHGWAIREMEVLLNFGHLALKKRMFFMSCFKSPFAPFNIPFNPTTRPSLSLRMPQKQTSVGVSRVGYKCDELVQVCDRFGTSGYNDVCDRLVSVWQIGTSGRYKCVTSGRYKCVVEVCETCSEKCSASVWQVGKQIGGFVTLRLWSYRSLGSLDFLIKFVRRNVVLQRIPPFEVVARISHIP